MFKIGIIGTENSHAMSFAKGLNLPGADGKFLYENMRVTKVFGDAASAQKLINEAGAETLANSAEDFFDCDAVMITARRGSEHYRLALPYVKKGMPVFIDKPFTVNPAEAAELIALAEKSGSLISGGSACKYAGKVLAIAEKAATLTEKGELISASLNFGIYMDIEYDGFFFYASHLVEMCIAIFGAGIKSVTARRHGASVTAIAEYNNNISAALHFTGGTSSYGCTLYAKNEVIFDPIDISGIFDAELKVFADMVINRKQPGSLNDFIMPVKLMCAIKNSYDSGNTVIIV